jgi:hypothetical protein
MVKKFKVMEAWENDAPGKGKVIASNLTEKEADEVLSRLYDSDKHWWKEEEEDELPPVQRQFE